MSDLPLHQQPVTSLRGVGAAIAAKLNNCNIHSLQDLVLHLPTRYEDRTRLTPLSQSLPGTRCVVEGDVVDVKIAFGRRRSLKCLISDGGAWLTLRFFHFSKAQHQRIANAQRLRCFGEISRGADGLEMYHPEYQTLNTTATSPPMEESLTPIYPTTEGISQTRLRSLIGQAWAKLDQQRELEDLLADVSTTQAWLSLSDAINLLHHPPPDTSLALMESGEHPAQQRLAFEELLAHHLSLLQIRHSARRNYATPFTDDADCIDQFRGSLKFDLTPAQFRVFSEISTDLRQPQPMLRLLQGDVGSGKTVVAAMAVVLAANSRIQTALMVPTEILAEQHIENFSHWFAGTRLKIAWLSGRLKGKKRDEQLALIAGGEADLVIGTHALFQHDVVFHKLGLIIVDEQHKFGVHQRLALRDKAARSGAHPHQLVMTATPIPRTLTMSAYADLDCSIIDELPPGRSPVVTAVISDQKRDEVIQRVDSACREGRQVYWVCTLIEESDVIISQAAETTAELLSHALPHLRIGLIHGRMAPAEKKKVMAEFAAGDIVLLVATTVIEVGVDVANASLMIIENPERLGLAQLHQLRGRVGRGSAQSHCLLMYSSPIGETTRRRLHTMRSTNDGFKIAEEDLKIRGPGEVLGTRQTGDIGFKVADLLRDEGMLPQVRQVAQELLSTQPRIAQSIIDRWLGNARAYGQV